MNKQEFINFLESYHVVLELENSEWKFIQYHNESILLVIEGSMYYVPEGKEPPFDCVIRIDFNNDNASLSFTDNFNIKRHFLKPSGSSDLIDILSQEFENYNCMKTKTEYFKSGGGSITVKSDYRSITEMLTIAIDKLNATL